MPFNLITASVDASQEELRELLDLAALHGTPTGSSCWGVNTEDSDVDYIIPYTVLPEWVPEELPPYEHNLHGTTRSLKIYPPNRPCVNLIVCYDTATLEAWSATTEAMGKLSTLLIKDKGNRVAIFGALRTAYYRLYKGIV